MLVEKPGLLAQDYYAGLKALFGPASLGLLDGMCVPQIPVSKKKSPMDIAVRVPTFI